MIGAMAALLSIVGGLPMKAKAAPSEPQPQALPPGAARPRGYGWLRHQGGQERLRRMRQSQRRVARLKDPASALGRAAVKEAVADEPEPWYGELHLTHVALLAAEDTGATWAQSMAYLLVKFDEIAEASA